VGVVVQVSGLQPDPDSPVPILPGYRALGRVAVFALAGSAAENDSGSRAKGCRAVWCPIKGHWLEFGQHGAATRPGAVNVSLMQIFLVAGYVDST